MGILRLLIVVIAAVPLAALQLGEAAPVFAFEKTWNLAPKIHTLVDVMGKPAVVEFWATWCPPCVENVPHMNDIHARYARQGLAIIAVSDEADELIDRFVFKHSVSYGVVRAPGAGNKYGVSSIPYAFLIDAQGKLAWQGHPAELDTATLDQFMSGGAVQTAKPKDDRSKTVRRILLLAAGITVTGGLWLYRNRRRKPPNTGSGPGVAGSH